MPKLPCLNCTRMLIQNLMKQKLDMIGNRSPSYILDQVDQVCVFPYSVNLYILIVLGIEYMYTGK